MTESKYKVGYLDEDEMYIAIVRSKLSSAFDISPIEVPIELEQIWTEVQNRGLDALIVDFQLYGSGEVSFDGNDVVKAVSAHNKHFPMIILTSYESKALDELDNVLIIKGKNQVNNPEELPIFIKMLSSLISSYKSKLADCQNTVLKLQNKDSLSVQEEALLYKAQLFLSEVSLDDTVSANMFSQSYSKQLNDLLAATDDLISKLKNNEK